MQDKFKANKSRNECDFDLFPRDGVFIVKCDKYRYDTYRLENKHRANETA